MAEIKSLVLRYPAGAKIKEGQLVRAWGGWAMPFKKRPAWARDKKGRLKYRLKPFVPLGVALFPASKYCTVHVCVQGPARIKYGVEQARKAAGRVVSVEQGLE